MKKQARRGRIALSAALVLGASWGSVAINPAHSLVTADVCN